MQQESASLEMMRWGYAHLPGAVFFYAKELDLDMEDIGIISTIFYAFEKTKPLYQSGVRTGQILQLCPILTTNKLSRRLSKLSKQGAISIVETDSKSFTDKIVLLEPLIHRLEELVSRDHPKFKVWKQEEELMANDMNRQLEEYQETIQQLELRLEDEKSRNALRENNFRTNPNFKKVADFIAKKTGNLLSVKMENELQKWLDEWSFTPEFLLCMLELAFERNVMSPRDITKIARDLREYSINTVEGMELYFSNYVDQEKNRSIRTKQFDPDIAEFGNFTGVDMNADARKNIYYKWRYDWGFTHSMIMKAGEIMCQRTKNGGLEYIDSVLNNWMSKEIRSIDQAEKELAEFKKRNKGKNNTASKSNSKSNVKAKDSFELYVPPDVLEELKSNA